MVMNYNYLEGTMHLEVLSYYESAGWLYHQLLLPAREAAGLTQAELDILLFLANNPDCDTASHIVSLRRLAKSNVSVGIRSLERKGFLQRRTDETDRRVEHLTLTTAAAPTVELGCQGQEEFGRILVQDFSSQDREALRRLMGRIQRNLESALNARCRP